MYTAAIEKDGEEHAGGRVGEILRFYDFFISFGGIEPKFLKSPDSKN